ncbi:MAG TPA: quinol:electron acceptor oxidoreductase subunit ActD [Blastocatellia bacterium]|nr:quinol:electron acceptor oxidoreductase subunit ActD [Blastocatellia bacterium]
MAKAERMTTNVLAAFDTTDEATAATATLKRVGFDAGDITLMSNKPAPAAVEEAGKRCASRIGAFAIIGGAVGATAALTLTILASKRMGLNVGGMPVVAPWAFSIIVFEVAALAAILASVTRMIYEAGLLRPRATADYDEDVAHGKVVVAVSCSDGESADKAKSVFSERGGQIKP